MRDGPVEVGVMFYWTERSSGFAVDGPDGRVGTVMGVRRDGRDGRPTELVVRDATQERRILLLAGPGGWAHAV
jgi:hypothetical protein